MNSSTTGRGRLVVATGAIILIASCFLQWWQMGGGPGLPELKDIGISDGRVLLIFLAATASLFLLLKSLEGRGVDFEYDGEMAVDVALDKDKLALYPFEVENAAQAGRDEAIAHVLCCLRGGRDDADVRIAAVGLLVLARGVFEVVDSRRAY